MFKLLDSAISTNNAAEIEFKQLAHVPDPGPKITPWVAQPCQSPTVSGSCNVGIAALILGSKKASSQKSHRMARQVYGLSFLSGNQILLLQSISGAAVS